MLLTCLDKGTLYFSILNHAMPPNMIPELGSCLSYNFNHRMYVDDLIIITRASRKFAHTCRFCLDLNSKLMGKQLICTNQLYTFLSWLNHRLSRSIRHIHGFPCTYLGVSVSRSLSSEFPICKIWFLSSPTWQLLGIINTYLEMAKLFRAIVWFWFCLCNISLFILYLTLS